jgi:hypothetical protein
MAYTAAASFVTNGSAGPWLTLTDPATNLALTVHCYSPLGSASPTVLPDSCTALVTWARNHGVKVHIGEIALDAGDPTGSWALAQAQWAAWAQFCTDNSDVLLGWNWWANSAGGWWDDGDSGHGSHWGLTTDDGNTQTIYMNLIEATL